MHGRDPVGIDRGGRRGEHPTQERDVLEPHLAVGAGVRHADAVRRRVLDPPVVSVQAVAGADHLEGGGDGPDPLRDLGVVVAQRAADDDDATQVEAVGTGRLVGPGGRLLDGGVGDEMVDRRAVCRHLRRRETVVEQDRRVLEALGRTDLPVPPVAVARHLAGRAGSRAVRPCDHEVETVDHGRRELVVARAVRARCRDREREVAQPAEGRGDVRRRGTERQIGEQARPAGRRVEGSPRRRGVLRERRERSGERVVGRVEGCSGQHARPCRAERGEARDRCVAPRERLGTPGAQLRAAQEGRRDGDPGSLHEASPAQVLGLLWGAGLAHAATSVGRGSRGPTCRRSACSWDGIRPSPSGPTLSSRLLPADHARVTVVTSDSTSL